MNRHEQIQKIINNEDFFRGDTLGMNNYINSCKATENKLHQVEIENITLTVKCSDEYGIVAKALNRLKELELVNARLEKEIREVLKK
jgi:hypothetical protein